MFTGCIMRERSSPCNATWCPLQFFNYNGVILCATGQSKTCSLISAKRRGMHPPVNPDLSFFSDCLLILLGTAQHMFGDCYNQTESKCPLVAVRNASKLHVGCLGFNICMHRNTNMHMHAYHMNCGCHLCVSSVPLCAWMESRWGRV